MSEHDSDVEQLIQCADFLAGAIKLKLDFGLGTRDPNSKIIVAGEGGEGDIEMEQSFYFFAALRYCLWGRVHDFGDELSPYPKKMVMDRGVVIVSSAASSTIAKAVSFIDGDYMGFVH